MSMKKVLNFVLIYLSFYLSKALKRPLDWGMPMKIGFEPTTFCNLRCPECPSGLRNFTRPTGTSDLTLFERVITELHPHLVYLLLYFQGEPYLNPHFLKMARIASQHGIYAATSTNGHYLSPEKARETVESGLSEVIVSVDGATQVTYEAYRVGGNLEKVKEGIRNLVHARAEARTMHPFIILQFLVVRPNEHEIEAIQEMGKALGVDQVLFKTAQIYDFENGHPLIPTQTKYSRYKQVSGGKYILKNPLHNQCWKLWQGAEITWDGKVLPCCFDKDAEFEMGNVGETDFRSIWKSPSYQSFRQQILHSRQQIDMCRNCSEGTRVWG
ncbi:MAG: radical SAM/SPASM domain-containing protein [Bacteroidota bacterium]